ncbi:unnamed protein product [Adineta steineri]|uniref:Uncharacterized protein n=1 Tax=Adineta steineri TaxID=433720 RepID=A0A820C5F2_9BILA|nr:unnamed protein product [Adineta steineri]
MIPVELIIMHFINQIYNENVFFYQIPKVDNTQEEEEEQIEIKYIKSSKCISQKIKFTRRYKCLWKTRFDFQRKQIG